MTDGLTPERDEKDMVLAAEHVLGLLGAAEDQAFVARLRTEPRLRAQVAAWAEDFTRLTDDIEEVTPPAHVQEAIEARLFGKEQPSRAPRLIASFLGLGVVFAAAALAAVLFLDPFGQRLSPATLLAQIEGEDSGLRLIAGWHPDENVMVIRREAGAAPAGRVLELWLIVGENAPVSLGVLPDGQEIQLVLSDDIETRLPRATLAVSDEPPGGSPTGQPTGSVLGLGTVTDL